jgi:hypothetical protein
MHDTNVDEPSAKGTVTKEPRQKEIHLPTICWNQLYFLSSSSSLSSPSSSSSSSIRGSYQTLSFDPHNSLRGNFELIDGLWCKKSSTGRYRVVIPDDARKLSARAARRPKPVARIWDNENRTIGPRYFKWPGMTTYKAP